MIKLQFASKQMSGLFIVGGYLFPIISAHFNLPPYSRGWQTYLLIKIQKTNTQIKIISPKWNWNFDEGKQTGKKYTNGSKNAEKQKNA